MSTQMDEKLKRVIEDYANQLDIDKSEKQRLVIFFSTIYEKGRQDERDDAFELD